MRLAILAATLISALVSPSLRAQQAPAIAATPKQATGDIRTEATVVVAATGTGTPPSPAASVPAVPVNSLGALGALAGLLAWGAARRRKVR